MTLNRQINTGFNASKDQKIELEATKETQHNGKTLAAGEVVQVSKSEAKRLLATSKGTFRIRMY